MAGDPSKRAPVGTIVLLVLAALLHAAMLGCLADSPNADAFGQAIVLLYAAFLGVVLWLVLAALLLTAVARGRMPLWATLAMVVLWPLSAVAVFMAGDAYSRGDPSAIWVPAFLPPLFALYALWARLPALHATFRAGTTSMVFAGAIAVLAVTPLMTATRAALPDPARDARLAEAGKVQEDRMARAALDRQEAQFASLGPDSPLADYLIYLSSMEYGERALAGIRRVKNRQADAALLLQQGRLADLRELSHFDVAPTAELCQAYGAALAAAAGKVTKARSDYLSAAIDLELQLSNMKWLTTNHCDLGQPLGLLETNLRAVEDSDRMIKFADRLAALRRAR